MYINIDRSQLIETVFNVGSVCMANPAETHTDLRGSSSGVTLQIKLFVCRFLSGQFAAANWLRCIFSPGNFYAYIVSSIRTRRKETGLSLFKYKSSHSLQRTSAILPGFQWTANHKHASVIRPFAGNKLITYTGDFELKIDWQWKLNAVLRQEPTMPRVRTN